MKHLFILCLCVIAGATGAVAQTRIKASDIINQINNDRNVEYTNAVIEGDLDLTDLKNRASDRPHWFSFNDDTYESFVGVSLKFTNCTFLGDVLAYYHIERRDETYVAHFEEDAVFANCTFKKASEFKYSKFKGLATFAGCTFNDEANFKYAKFSNGPLFSNTRFTSGADFKYADFPGETSFEKATFQGLANFKYSRFQTPLNMNSVAFKGSEDFKYTKIDGRSFTSHLLTNR
jgi:uncharacterized protein YjbI with pentapeptide repeats